MQTIARFVAGLALAGLATAASPQEYPSKTIRMIVPFAAGGPTDVIARTVGQKLTESWGQPVVIDNRGGVGGNLGTDIAAKAAPDGYTLVMVIVAHAINASLYSKLPYDPVKDFAPVSLAGAATIVLVAHPSVQAKSIRELIALGKAKPGKINWGSPGTGTPHHLAGEMFKTLTGIDMVHIPYKGAAPAIVDLLGGQVSLAFVSLPAALPQIRAGKLTALGVSGPQRSAVAPEVPTIAESGFPGYELENWYGALAPAGTPRAIVNKLNGEIVKILQTPEVKDRLNSQGFEIRTSTPEQFAAYLKSEIVKWAKIVKDSGAKVD